MVQYKNIVKVIEEYTEKCRTIAEIKQILSEMSDTEKFDYLFINGLINEGEMEWYGILTKELEERKRALERHSKHLEDSSNKKENLFMVKIWSESIEDDKKAIEKYENDLFKMERRIVEGYDKEPKNIPYDESKYSLETQTDAYDENLGALERKQVETQNGISLTEEDIESFQHYYGWGAKQLNSRLNNGRIWTETSDEEKKELNKKFNKMERRISSVISNTKGLVQPMIVFHGGRFDVTKIQGDKIKFKGYTSTSFQQDVADTFKDDSFTNVPKGLRYTYKILLPKGQKGYCANDNKYQLTDYKREHELLLDKGFEAQIVDIDYKNHIVTIQP